MKIFKNRSKKGLNESIEKEIAESKENKKLNERAELNTRKIDWMELNELLAGLKDNIDEQYNDDLQYFRVITGGDGHKAYIDLETKDDVDLFDGFSVEDIMYMSEEDASDYGFDMDKFKETQQKIFDEQDMIEKTIIPKVAREWGFRRVKENCQELDEAREPREIATVIDTVEQNLYHHPLPSFLIDNDKDIKFVKGDGSIGTSKIYDMDQISYGPNGSYSDIYVNVVDKEDADFAQKIADIMTFESEFVDKEPQKGYNHVFAIHVPNYVYDKPMAEFCAKNDIPAEAFKNVDSVATKIAKAKKKLEAGKFAKQDLLDEGQCGKVKIRKNRKTEDLGADLSDFQKWVDYDMKHYGRISNETMQAIEDNGLSVTKDQYGDYEVIPYRKDESCKNESCQTNEAISPERKELNRRVSEIADKWGENITEDDIKFLNDNGLDLKGNKIVVKETGTIVKIPTPWWMDRDNNSNVDWVDKAIKDEERTRINYNRKTTSDELEKAKAKLKDAQRWGTDRQEKVWQGKVDREEQRLKDARKNAYTRAWRDEQNDEMKQDYETMKRINRKLDPQKNIRGYGYDFDIAWAEARKADREEELLKRYKDELDELQRRIDDAKQAKQDAIDWKNQKLRKKIEIVDDDI